MKTNLLTPQNKSKVLSVAVIALTIATIAGGTLAYFTDSKTAHNVITSGGIEIEIQEWADEAKEKPFEDIEGVMPGESCPKFVEIQNNDANAWVRVKFEISVTSANGKPLDAKYISLETGDDWDLKDDGYYYYNTYLPASETSTFVLKAVHFGEDMPNAYQNCKVEVNVAAQAVQYANNVNATGWPAE